MFDVYIQKYFEYIMEHLGKFEMNLMNIKYPKRFLKQCN